MECPQSQEANPAILGGWLALLPSTVRADVLDACEARNADSGKILYGVGDLPNGLYGLMSGSIRMETVQSRYGPTMLSIFHTGSWLGEVEMFSRMARLTTLTALRPIEYLFLPAASLELLGKAAPEIWRALGHLAAEHVSLAVASLEDLTIRSSSVRIVAVLLRLCGARLETIVGTPVTELDVTQTELAEMANLSRSMVGERLDGLEQSGLIDRTYGRILVRDIDTLRRTLGIGGPIEKPD